MGKNWEIDVNQENTTGANDISSSQVLKEMREKWKSLKEIDAIIDNATQEEQELKNQIANELIASLTSSEGFEIKRNDQLGHLNAILPKNYRIDFYKAADKVFPGQRVILDLDTNVLSLKWKNIDIGKAKEIWKIREWEGKVIVKPWDTISKIAEKRGITVDWTNRKIADKIEPWQEVVFDDDSNTVLLDGEQVWEIKAWYVSSEDKISYFPKKNKNNNKERKVQTSVNDVKEKKTETVDKKVVIEESQDKKPINKNNNNNEALMDDDALALKMDLVNQEGSKVWNDDNDDIAKSKNNDVKISWNTNGVFPPKKSIVEKTDGVNMTIDTNIGTRFFEKIINDDPVLQTPISDEVLERWKTQKILDNAEESVRLKAEQEAEASRQAEKQSIEEAETKEQVEPKWQIKGEKNEDNVCKPEDYPDSPINKHFWNEVQWDEKPIVPDKKGWGEVNKVNTQETQEGEKNQGEWEITVPIPWSQIIEVPVSVEWAFDGEVDLNNTTGVEQGFGGEVDLNNTPGVGQGFETSIVTNPNPKSKTNNKSVKTYEDDQGNENDSSFGWTVDLSNTSGIGWWF